MEESSATASTRAAPNAEAAATAPGAKAPGSHAVGCKTELLAAQPAENACRSAGNFSVYVQIAPSMLQGCLALTGNSP